MGLLEQATADIERITSNSNEWAAELSFTATNGQTAVINGLHTKHHLAVDTDGNTVNSKNAHASFSEKFLIDVGYPVRNSGGEVSMKNHRVNVKDSTGIVKNYVVIEAYPDETIGLIVLILGDFV